MARIIVGAFIILFGFGLFVQQFPILGLIGLNFETITSLFWIVVGVMLLMKRHSFWGTVLILVGLLGFVSGLFRINSWSVFFPILVIAFGISILFRRNGYTHYNSSHDTVGASLTDSSENDSINESVVFGALERRYTTKKFTGGKVDIVFAGMKLDLREVQLAAQGATLEVNAVFGGGEIIVSPKMRVVSNGTGVMGEWSNQFSSSDEKGPTLKITGSAVFAGVEVKN